MHFVTLQAFNRAISTCPARGSCYNNRAQLYRLMHKNAEARVDLEKAIELSNGKGRVAAQAYTQRALLERLNGNLYWLVSK